MDAPKERLFAHQTVGDGAQFLQRRSVASSPLPSPLPLAWERERSLPAIAGEGPGRGLLAIRMGISRKWTEYINQRVIVCLMRV
ncbi:hypothetical protein C7S18_04240 [Ahniella affigens]|uniref:Uncharacterized protein n=1 Tax=Ahniella affigens TaxID=2021234 RepID=A0A2P1PNN3_9GAMM|nr:hypothetical protein C7S18_04240 [Ahniella affigens]